MNEMVERKKDDQEYRFPKWLVVLVTALTVLPAVLILLKLVPGPQHDLVIRVVLDGAILAVASIVGLLGLMHYGAKGESAAAGYGDEKQAAHDGDVFHERDLLLGI